VSDDGDNFLARVETRRANESKLFEFVAAEIEARAKLNSLQARGTLSLALKLCGCQSRNVGRDELSMTLNEALPGELGSRGVSDAAEICATIDTVLCAAVEH